MEMGTYLDTEMPCYRFRQLSEANKEVQVPSEGAGGRDSKSKRVCEPRMFCRGEPDNADTERGAMSGIGNQIQVGGQEDIQK